MPTKNKKFLLRKLGNKESVSLSRAEVYRIVENEQKVVDSQIQQVLLTEIIRRKEELLQYHDFNYMLAYQELSDGELTPLKLSYLLVVLFGGAHHE